MPARHPADVVRPSEEIGTGYGRLRGLSRADPSSGHASLAFYAVPFARHPAGDLRFAGPQPPGSWRGVRDATRPADGAHNGLHLNVFTPDPYASLPVLFWVHGGGFTYGSPLDEQLDGVSLNRAGIVLVSATYRLGFEGFGHVDGAVPNRGVRDWLAALEWVRHSIHSFGGDPDRVTIGGHSAGGGAALTLLGMPQAKHLFHQVFSLSGALGDVTPERARERARRLAALSGVDATGLADVAPGQLAALLPKAASAEQGDAARAERLHEGLPWGPVVDGELVRLPVAESVRAGSGADKALLIGAADDEFTPAQRARRRALTDPDTDRTLRPFIIDESVRAAYLAANSESAARGNADLLGRLLSDGICRALVPQLADLRAHADAPTWTYRFGWRSSVTGSASHTIDLPFWFDGLGKDRARRLLGDDAPQSLADAMHTALVDFVRGADPGWPAWRTGMPVTRQYGLDAATSETAYASVRPLIPGG